MIVNESAGDVKIVKAVILRPGLVPSTFLPMKYLQHDVHAVYNSFIFNNLLKIVSSGVSLSHSDVVDRAHLKDSDVIGYFTKEGTQVLEYKLDENAHKYLTDLEINDVESELKLARW